MLINILKAADAMAEAQKGILASLVAAVSLLRRSPKKAAPSDKMFDIMINDYERAIKAGREALSAYEAAKREAEAKIAITDDAIAKARQAPVSVVFSIGDGTGITVGGRFHGWLCRQHPDGQWITVKKLEAVEPFPKGLLP